jgi:hypothetical protein
MEYQRWRKELGGEGGREPRVVERLRPQTRGSERPAEVSWDLARE